jgi:ketosteroid isomerase-like protein
MNDPNSALLRRAYDAFGKGDMPAVLETLSPDITWHIPGRSPLSGRYKGYDEVLGFFSKSMQLSGGTLVVTADEILASDETVVVLATVSAQRSGRSWSSPEVHTWHVVDGKAVSFREFQGDQQSEDEFWSR